MKPWSQPCGTPVAAALKRLPQRHSVHRALKRVRTQLRVAQLHFKKDLKDVHEIYSKVYKVLSRKHYNMNWLPENQYEWYYREVWCLEKGKKAERALPRLHGELQKFAVTFHHLKEFQLKSNINVDLIMSRRNKIIDGMNNEILRVLCEVDTAILNMGLQFPKQKEMPMLTKNPNWAKEGDLTSMLIQDWGVLRIYRDFLNNWMKAFRNATATGPGTCDPNMIRTSFRPRNSTKGIGGKSKKIPKIRKQSRLMRKRPLGSGRNSSLPQRPRKGPPRGRLMRKKQNKSYLETAPRTG